MHRDIQDGVYFICVNADRKYSDREPDRIVGFSVRVTISRPDRRPVQGTLLTFSSDEMVPTTGGFFDTVELALDHGEAWGRHCTTQWREAADRAARR